MTCKYILEKKLSLIPLFLKDGTLEQCVVYELMDMAFIYDILVMLMIEYSAYTMSTGGEDAIVGGIRKRIERLNIRC